MNVQNITFVNSLGEALGPFLTALRSTGFFEAPVYMSVMTCISIYWYVRLIPILKSNGTFGAGFRVRFSKSFHVAYYMMCFMTTNVVAVAFKTMIREEMDYTTEVWFLNLVSPLHFFIASVTGGYIWLIYRNQKIWIDQVLCLYIQIGLIGGYTVGIYRLIYEPFDLLDVTTGVSGLFMIACFGMLNWDVIDRFKSNYKVKKPNRSQFQIPSAELN